MFDQHNQFALPPASYDYEPERELETDRIDYALNGICRFTGLLALGITITLIVRWVPALQPFYWVGTIACILALVLPAYLSRSARLLAMAIALMVSMFMGWFDAIAHLSQQTQQQVQQHVQEVLK